MMDNELENLRNDFYTKYYKNYCVTADCGSFSAKYFHSKIEVFPKFKNLPSISGSFLEVGAGEGEHTEFVKTSTYDSYTLCDVRDIHHNINLKGVKRVTASVENLPFSDESFDRVIVTCLLHHVANPVKALLETKRVIKKRLREEDSYRGLVTIALPCDPGIAYRFARKMFSYRADLPRQGKSEFDFLLATEHRNHYLSLRTMLLHIFKNAKVCERNYPFRLKSYNLNAFTVFQIYM